MSDNTALKLRIPRQDLTECAAFRADVESARAWAKNLPVANTKLVVQKLRVTISELNRVKITPDVRFYIMEELRPSLHVALSTMSKRFLNQALVMPEEPRQMAELADQLYSLAATAYTIVAAQTLQQRDNLYSVNPARLLGEAIQRAITFVGKKMLQTFQLHQPIQHYGWLELHQLYAMAERQKIENLPVEDKLGGDRTITTLYLQSLILGCCKPNQLRQSDLAAVYRGLQEWSGLMQIRDSGSDKGLFLVDLGLDQPPVYSALHSAAKTAQQRLIDTEALVDHLKDIKGRRGKGEKLPIVFDKDTSLPPNMLDHLIVSLGSMSTRNFTRTGSREILGLSIGLSSTHYHVAGRKTFEQVLYGLDYVQGAAEQFVVNRFMEKPESRDDWERANPHDDHPEDEAHQYHGELVDDPDLAVLEGRDTGQLAEERYPIYPVHMTDASPGGYCLEWSVSLPSTVRTGDIVGVREGGRSDWIIAVIRWVSQLRDAKSLIGVELLSPRAMPYGARIQHKTEVESALRRVLLLPEIKLVGKPHTLITPRAGFKERQKVTLVREGEEFLVQLLRQISATGNFAQFDFRYIKQLEQVVAEDKASPLDSAFDSLWSSI